MRRVTVHFALVLTALTAAFVPPSTATAQQDEKPPGPDLSQPLGSAENPVRTPRGGQPGYLQRLRCPDGEPPTLGGRGSVGVGPYGNIIDLWTITCGETKHSVYMDHYHAGYDEKLPIPGFELASRHTPQLIVRDDLLYRFGSSEPFSGEITDETDSGEPAARMTVVNGRIEGTLTRYYEGGEPGLEMRFVNGREHGPFHSYYPDGVIRQEGTYVHGRIDGVLAAYDQAGRLREVRSYRDGLLHGEAVRWSDDGGETQRRWFLEGQPISASVADSQGLEAIDMFAPFVAEPGDELWELAVPVGADLTEPVRVHGVEPTGAEAEAGARAELEIVVATDGAVGAIRVATSSGNSAFDEAAATAVRQWRYEPTIVDGKAVPVSMTISIESGLF